MSTLAINPGNHLRNTYGEENAGINNDQLTGAFRYKNKKSKIFRIVKAEKRQKLYSTIISTNACEISNPVNNIRLSIKNMVSNRCKMLVDSELIKLGIHNAVVRLGEVELKENLSPEDYFKFNLALKKIGLELIRDRASIIVEKIKNIIVELIHYSDDPLTINLSDYLSQKLNYNYTYLANLFSKVQGTTIEKFFIAHKIERAKELFVYDDLNLSEIAWKLHYSSVAHLSNQFKKVTGLTPSLFKKLRDRRLIALENL